MSFSNFLKKREQILWVKNNNTPYSKKKLEMEFWDLKLPTLTRALDDKTG